MANPNPKKDNLIRFKSTWRSGKTKAYRIPEAIAPQVLELAHQIDKGITVTSNTQADEHSLGDAIAILTAALKLRANKGGAIKDEIRKALSILQKLDSL